MRKNNYVYTKKDILIGVIVIAVLLFKFRLWPLIAVGIFIGMGLLVKKTFFPTKNQTTIQEDEQEPKIEPFIPQETEYDFIVKSVSFYIYDVYPNAQWIWENAKAWEQIQKGEDVYVRLNKAGEYRRVKVRVQNQSVIGIEVLETENHNEANVSETEEQVVKDDSERIAFDWVDSHITELNEKCNDIIGQGNSELLLTHSELPEEKYWGHVCDELVKAGLENVEILPGEGIKIKLK